MFGTNKVNTQVSDFMKQVNSLSIDNDRYKRELEDVQSRLEMLVADKDNEINSLKKLHKEEVSKLSAKQAEVDLLVNRKVFAQLSSIGVNTFAVDTIIGKNSDTNDVEVLAKFRSLSGIDQTEFYKKNKEAISRAMLR